MRLRQPGIKLQHLTVHFNGPAPIPLRLQRQGKFDERFNMVRLNPQRFAKSNNGLIELPAIKQKFPQIAVKVRHIGIECDGALNEIEADFNASRLSRHDAQEMQGIREIRILRQDLPVNRLRLGQSPSPVMLGRNIHRLPRSSWTAWPNDNGARPIFRTKRTRRNQRCTPFSRVVLDALCSQIDQRPLQRCRTEIPGISQARR